MDKIIADVVKHFAINRDANATNRGFYYQYLSLLYKWLDSFVQGTDIEIYSEVDDDIKEVGQDLVFTQVKSFTSTFSLNSEDVKKTLFNFYILFLKYSPEIPTIRFVFQTNTSVKQNEKILDAWIKDPLLSENKQREKTLLKLKEILVKQFKKHRDKVLSNTKKSITDKENFKTAYQKALSLTEHKRFEDFVLSIRWDFQNQNPESEILILQGKIVQMLDGPKFRGYPSDIIVNRLLTEIYRRSTHSDPEKRKLTPSLLDLLRQGSCTFRARSKLIKAIIQRKSTT